MLAGQAGKYARYEIERKFLLKALPRDLPASYEDLHDTYFAGSSLRLRIVRSESGEILGRKLTKKDRAESFATHVITSLYLSEDDLAALGALKGSALEKRRHFIETPERRISIDVFKAPFDGLILAEAEFLDEASCRAFAPDPSWVEVTGDPRFSCGLLATQRAVEAGFAGAVGNLAALAARIEGPYGNVLAGEVNDHCVRLAVNEDRAYEWHSHPDSDELFLVLDGTLSIELEGRTPVTLGARDFFTVPKGQVHRTIATGRTVNLCVESRDAKTVFLR